MADERNREQLVAAQPACPVLYVPDDALYEAAPAPPADLADEDAALLTFTSGTAGEPKCVVHGAALRRRPARAGRALARRAAR